MKIPAAVRRLAVKHRITVRRDHHGDYSVWDSTDPQSVRYPFHHMTATGAIAAIRKLFLRGQRKQNPRYVRSSASVTRRRAKIGYCVFIRAVGRYNAAHGPRLYYLGGQKFSAKGTPVEFRSVPVATAMAKHLRAKFPALKRYRFYAKPC